MVQQAFRVDNLSTSNIEFKANSFVSSLVANTALASNVHLVLPGSVGTSGQVLATDGSGNLSFINQGIGGPADTVQDNVNATSANVNLVQSNVTSLTSTVDSFGIYANNTFGADGSNVSVANVTSQEFSLDGSTNTFTLVNSTDNVNKLLVSYGGIAQKPSEYQVSNTTLTLSNTRPLVSGTTLEVRFLEFEFAGSVTNTGNTGVVAGGSTTVIAPIAFGSVADVTNGSGTNLNWSNWNSNNATLDFTFDTPQPDTNYTVVTDCEVFDDAFVQITNKTTTGFRASFYDSSQNLQPSSFREFTFIVYGSTPTVDVNSLSGTSYSTTLYSNLAAGTTTFNAASTPALATYTAGKIGVYRNGVKLPSTDYTASDGTSLILNNATLLGDSIEVVNFGTLSLALDDITDVDLTTNSPANGQALVYVSANSKWEPGTVASSYGNSDVDTHLNQSTATANKVLSWDGSDYAWVDQSAGGASSGAALTEYEFTATANQTSFAATYIPNSIQVFLNGVKLANTDFTATNGTSVVLGANTASGDIVAISKIGGSSNLTVANASASGSGAISYDSGSEILTYTPPDLSVYQSTLVSNTNIKTINGTSLLGSGDISTGGGVAGTLGSLTKTFSNNETATITLSSNVSPVPNVSVFKEIPQPGVSSKGNWDVNANATNYEFFDEKPISYSSITLTPSATGDGTFTLSSGSFDSADVGKKVVGNSGSAIINSTAGAYTSVTPFADTSAISSWQLFGAQGKSDGSGIQLAGYINNYDLVNATYTTISPYLNQAEGYNYMTFKPDGTKVWIGGQQSDTIYEYNLGTGFDLSTITYSTSFAFATSSQSQGFAIKSDGTKAYIADYNSAIRQLDLSTAWNISTATWNNVSLATTVYNKGLYIKPDGTKLYTIGTGSDIREYTLSTPWDLSNYTLNNTVTLASPVTSNDIHFSADGTKFFVPQSTGGRFVNAYSLSTAWDTSSNITFITSFSIPEIGTYTPQDVGFNTDGSAMYVINGENASTSPARRILEYATGTTLHPYSQYFPALTNSTGQINSSTWLDINSMTADETKNGGDIFYAVSTDNRTSWTVIDNTNGVRNIVKNNSGIWQYNNSASYSSEVWVNGTNNNEHATLQEALVAQSFNRMNKAQLDSVSDANHYVLGDTLDLMIAPYAASGSSPLSDGVTINYDAEAFVEQAINGTDYKARFPTSNSVSIISLADQNLKVRVI